MKCKICSNSDKNVEYHIKEMMFGTKKPFRYFQCSNCHCLQIQDFPENMSEFYPDNYYSYQTPEDINKFKKYIMSIRNEFAFCGKKPILGKALYDNFPNPAFKSLKPLSLEKHWKILDVGCGSGNLLYFLKEWGFYNILGIDPFNKNEKTYRNNLNIKNMDIHKMTGKWDLVMFHHSLEHIMDQESTIKKAASLLSDTGTLLIRIPVVSSFAWKYYNVYWVQLDAPRHFFLHSIFSIKLLAEKCGLKLHSHNFDSDCFQFWGSEQYIRNIPLRSETSYAVSRRKSIFSKKQISLFSKKADYLNSISQGDQVSFYFKKIT